MLLWLVGGGFIVLALIVFTWTEIKKDRQPSDQGAVTNESGVQGGRVAKVTLPPALPGGTPCPLLTEAGAMCEKASGRVYLRRDPSADPSLYSYFWPNADEKDAQDRPVYKEAYYYLAGKRIKHTPGMRPEKSDMIELVPNDEITIVFGLSATPPTTGEPT
ncbi:MAG: hypothetical protein AAB582_01590 [Patescibacteria group bacterium]